MTEKKPTAPPYSGPLADPIRLHVPVIAHVLGVEHPAVQEAMVKENWRIVDEIIRKLDLLLDHHELDQDNPHKWEMLVFRIARQFIPGFRLMTAAPAGAPLEWGPFELAGLYIEVEALTKQGMSAMDACRLLLRADDGAWRYPRCRSVRTLYRRYQQSKRSAYVRLMTETKDDQIRQMWRDVITEPVSESVTDT